MFIISQWNLLGEDLEKLSDLEHVDVEGVHEVYEEKWLFLDPTRHIEAGCGDELCASTLCYNSIILVISFFCFGCYRRRYSVISEC